MVSTIRRRLRGRKIAKREKIKKISSHYRYSLRKTAVVIGSVRYSRRNRTRLTSPDIHVEDENRVIKTISIGSELEYLILDELKKNRTMTLKALEEALEKRASRMNREIKKRTLRVQLAILEQLGKVKNIAISDRRISEPTYLITEDGLREIS